MLYTRACFIYLLKKEDQEYLYYKRKICFSLHLFYMTQVCYIFCRWTAYEDEMTLFIDWLTHCQLQARRLLYTYHDL